MTHDQLVILDDQIGHCRTQLGRWEKFLAYERNGERRHGNLYGVRKLERTVERWKLKLDALEAARKQCVSGNGHGQIRIMGHVEAAPGGEPVAVAGKGAARLLGVDIEAATGGEGPHVQR